ncbi:DUF5672 family protein [Novosphingobium sp.]|uniref:DUF5672 family protein n=1 Tax=Novosphingobium sp. TaxID=1874826 RepID=UPI003D115F97
MPTGALALLNLPQVTLVAISSVALDATARALALSNNQVTFAKALLLSDREPPAGMPEGIISRKIAPLNTRHAYSRFLFHELAVHIDTTHVLIVQWDGYILDSRAWNDAFLQYDYVGAPWPHFNDSHTVGNGGFSLRSKRLLQILSEYDVRANEAEDVAICRRLRPDLEERYAIRFAPADVAAHFSWERLPHSGCTFGYHGVFNMARLMNPRDFIRLLLSVGPNLVHRNEKKEIIFALVRRGAFFCAARALMLLSRRRV